MPEAAVPLAAALPPARARRRQGRHPALRRQAQELAPEFCNAYEPAQPPVGVTAGVDAFGRLVIRWSLGAGAVRAFIAVQRTTCAITPQYTVNDGVYIQQRPPGATA